MKAESLKIWHGSKWFSFSIGFQLLHLATHAGCDLLARLVLQLTTVYTSMNKVLSSNIQDGEKKKLTDSKTIKSKITLTINK